MSYKRRRKSSCYDQNSDEPFRISRFRMERFLKCPRCFYLDRRLGIDRPGMPGWPLGSAVDHLLKNEFDLLREKGEKHALMQEYGVDAVPLQHPDLSEWRDDNHQYKGICTVHEETNLELCGIVDDVWVNPDGEFYIVDYKSTSTTREISLDDKYKKAYKKQVEWYQWIFRQNGFDVSDTAYFVYANGLKGNRVFDGKIEFDTQIIEHEGDTAWIEPTIKDMKKCLESDEIPEADPECDYCAYRREVNKEVD